VVQIPVKTISTFNALHLGDNLVHLHFLRKLAQKYPDIHFTHGAPDVHLAQLYPLWQDLPNLTVKSIVEVGQGAINGWRGANSHWYTHPQRNDFVAYHLEFFRHLARLMGLESPIHCARDLLFDYPALKPEVRDQKSEVSEYDFLLVSSAPKSGQWSRFDPQAFMSLGRDLVRRGHRVISTDLSGCGVESTRVLNLDVTGIGRLSQRAKCIIGCVTGPMWPCLNIWNADTVKLRVHLLDQERVDYLPDRTVHCNNLSLVPEILQSHGLI
jgi:hypothetical protein